MALSGVKKCMVKSMSEIKINSVCESDPQVIELHGDIDFVSAPQAREIITKVVDNGHPDIYIDCSGIDYLDSSGLSILIDAWKRTETAGGNVCLISPSRQILQILENNGLDDQFEIIQTASIDPGTSLNISDHWHTSKFSIAARVEAVAGVRRRVVTLARTMPFNEQQIDDIRYAISEAVSNAVRHGSPDGERNKISVLCERSFDSFAVRITDKGDGFDPEALVCERPDEFAEGGRGLFFMRILMDQVIICFDHGTTVCLVKFLSNV